MQNHNIKEKKDLKKRAYNYALDIIRFFDNLFQETIELANMLGSSVLTLKGKR